MDLVSSWRVQMSVDSGTAVQSFATASDDSGTAFAAYDREEESDGSNWVDVVEAPSGGTTRRVSWIEIVNTDTVTHTVYVRMHDGTNARATKSWSIPPGKAIYWTPTLGWQVPNSVTAVGSQAWETNIIAALGAVQCDPGLALLEMQRAGNVAATPTNISTSVARCAFFRPPQTITVTSIGYYGVGSTSSVYRVAIYRYSDLARLTAELTLTTSVDTWASVGTSVTLVAGELYFIAVAVNATGTTAGLGCVGGTVAATTGRINTAPNSLPGKLSATAGYLSSYFFQFAVTSGALPDPAASLVAQAAWTGGMPLFFLE